ncbi:2-hydroxyhepta-2,4-diene-1,7-dioate isomerase [Sulfolobus sp. A20]|uniref:fumarylacetoacetate hydrolase family protein n=1 Tax=Sulfolobaceae TaxID=118883 RepID=UPI0008461B7B|nr:MULTISPECIES: fumarylacetoacetate hydrolase family protein [unclassified Sulfolobus]TRM77874.1 FAA hydrolase family protein [Sulfolobus sp. A20-N-F8]TRM81185.1 FAA hydrolase family protein [Sulfolobus sp. D5]TRM81445.1 FAA hydrolase family protein [Sulfolobus sp. A20-N-F6]TRM82613.1 FAA hydrolase family protein [Sulfolobus sp. F3]TRM88763.1 FAA hydrolase family protein [Sulfolobus sp. E3]TRN02175.1 FAA hydrolase family protein [Sulfolobus sp. E1]
MTKYLAFQLEGERKLGVVEGNYVHEIDDFDKEAKGRAYRLDEVIFDVPVIPSAIICTLVNTPRMLGVERKDEAKEMVKSPKFFLKLPNIITAHKKAIISPKDAIRPEVEIAVIIKKKMKEVKNKDELYDYILGFSVFNDITYPPGLKEDSYYAYRRDPADGKVKKMLMRGTHFRNKVRDTFAPLGPYIVTKDEVGDINSLGMRSYYDGKLIQDGNSEDFIFSIEEILLELSKIVTIPPMSVVTSGSVGYVNVEDQSEFHLKPISNALMVAEIENIGRLENPTIVDYQ